LEGFFFFLSPKIKFLFFVKKKRGKKLDYKNEKRGKWKERVVGIGPWIRQKFIKILTNYI